MDHSVYNFFDKIQRFWLVFRKNLLSMCVCYVIIMLLLYVGVSVGDLTSHNATDTTMIGIEMLCESGPDFKKAAERHIQMLKTYTNHMENKWFGDVLKVVYAEYSPTKGFARALETLEKAKNSSQQECARAIWLAGEQVEQYRMKAASFPDFLPLHEYQKVPNELVEDIKAALGESQKSLERFEKEPTLKNAVFLCEDDRRTMLLVFLARAGYNNGHSELFDEFQRAVAEAIKKEREKSDELPDGDLEKEFFDHIIRSEQRRFNVLAALKGGDMRKARTLMWEAIDIAYHERPVILKFTAAVDFGKGWERPDS